MNKKPTDFQKPADPAANKRKDRNCAAERNDGNDGKDRSSRNDGISRILPSGVIWRLLLAASLAIALFLLGAFVMDKVGAWKRGQDYESACESLNAQEKEAYGQMVNAWNTQADGLSAVDEARKAQYETIEKQAPMQTVCRLVIDAIDVDLPVCFQQEQESLLQDAAMHLASSSLPSSSFGIHTAIAAHSGDASHLLFTRLSELDLGDELTLRTPLETLTYVVDSIEVVRPEESQFLALDKKRNQLTLITCTPVGVNSHRLLVTGSLRNVSSIASESEMETQEHTAGIWMAAACALLLAGALVWIFFFREKKIRGKD